MRRQDGGGANWENGRPVRCRSRIRTVHGTGETPALPANAPRGSSAMRFHPHRNLISGLKAQRGRLHARRQDGGCPSQRRLPGSDQQRLPIDLQLHLLISFTLFGFRVVVGGRAGARPSRGGASRPRRAAAHPEGSPHRKLFTIHCHLFVEIAGRSRSETSPESHAPYISSRDFECFGNMEKPNFVDFGLIFKAENFFCLRRKRRLARSLIWSSGCFRSRQGARGTARPGRRPEAPRRRRRQQPRVRARARGGYRWWRWGFFLFLLFL